MNTLNREQTIELQCALEDLKETVGLLSVNVNTKSVEGLLACAKSDISNIEWLLEQSND